MSQGRFNWNRRSRRKKGINKGKNAQKKFPVARKLRRKLLDRRVLKMNQFYKLGMIQLFELAPFLVSPLDFVQITEERNSKVQQLLGNTVKSWKGNWVALLFSRHTPHTTTQLSRNKTKVVTDDDERVAVSKTWLFRLHRVHHPRVCRRCDNKKNTWKAERFAAVFHTPVYYFNIITPTNFHVFNHADVFGSRHAFALMGFFGLASVYMMRINLSVAIVDMVKTPQPIDNTTSFFGRSGDPPPFNDTEGQCKDEGSGGSGVWFFGICIYQIHNSKQ